MSYILLCRNPSTQKLVIVTDGEDDVPAEFKNQDEAIEAASHTMICRVWGYEILEIET